MNALFRCVLLACVATAATAGALRWTDASTAATTSAAAEDDPYAAFCTPVPHEAVVPPEVAAQHVLAVQVPTHAPEVPALDAASARPVAVRRGEVVEFRVSTPREGAVAVHGLSDVVRLQGGGSGVVRFKALYGGRFPLHFHSREGAHFEVAVLEVRG